MKLQDCLLRKLPVPWVWPLFKHSHKINCESFFEWQGIRMGQRWLFKYNNSVWLNTCGFSVMSILCTIYVRPFATFVCNNFGEGSASPHVKLMRFTFQALFRILSECKRVVPWIRIHRKNLKCGGDRWSCLSLWKSKHPQLDIEKGAGW